MAPDEDLPPRTPPNDRVGDFITGMADLGAELARRNQQTWAQISSHARSESYSADELTADAARAWRTAMDNAEDMWTFIARPPEAARTAPMVGTVFLRFWREHGTWSIPDPVTLEVPYWERRPEGLPDRADIFLAGDWGGVDALNSCLSARRHENAYRLDVTEPRDLEPGMYIGLIAIAERPLADLRVLVPNVDKKPG